MTMKTRSSIRRTGRSGRAALLVAPLAILLLAVSPRGALAQASGCCPGDPCCAARTTSPSAGGLLTLEDAVDLALRRNREIGGALYGLEEAREQASEAWSNIFPSVDLSASYTRNISPAVNFVPAGLFDPDAPAEDLVPLQFGADNVWTMTLTAEQPVLNAAAFLGVGAAGRFETLQQEVFRGRVQTVVTAVRSTYYDVLLAQERERLTRKSVERVRESLEETRALNRAGLVGDYDVLRLEVELANLEPNLLRAANAVKQSRRRLAVELDLEDTESLRVTGSLATMELGDLDANTPENRAILTFSGVDAAPGDAGPLTEASIGRLVEVARESRSDLRQLALTRDLRRTEMQLEQVEYLPELSVVGTYAINSSQNGDPDFFGAPRAYSRRVGVQFTLPVFQGFGRDARIDRRRATLRAVDVQQAQALDQAENEVRTLLEQIDEARARARGQRLAVRQAGRGFEIASAQFREGIGSQLELTDAEVALRESEFNYAQAVYDYLVARAGLDEATGRVPRVEGLPAQSSMDTSIAGRRDR